MSPTEEHEAWLEREGEQHVLRGNCSVGRAALNTLVLDSPRVSRLHSIIHLEDTGAFWLIDLGSSNGTAAPLLTLQELENFPCWLLVADIKNFTPLSRSIMSDQLAILVSQWLATCKEIIEGHQGAVNKYLGDGILAYWRDNDGAAENVAAVIAALKKAQMDEGPQFRFVVHFGMVAIGGVAATREETLMGSDVNLVFRLEKLVASLDEACGISDTAHAKLKELVPARLLGNYELKGFEGERAFFSA